MRHLTATALILILATSLGWGAKLYPDDFKGANIDPHWNWAKEPKTWDVNKTRAGWITWIGEFNSNLWCSDQTTRLYQTVQEKEDFDVETRLYCEWGNNDSDIAGLVVKFPTEDNWIMLKLWMHGDKTAQLQFQKKCQESGDGLTGRVAGYAPAGGKAELFLRLKREGDKVTGYFKEKEGDDWSEIGTTTCFDSTPMEIGLFGGVDRGNGKLLIQFDYFRDNTSPFKTPVDPQGKLACTWARIKG
ncbi:TPA: hypothetical protein EYP37_08150 [Candidatus Poribacteria bacterium]|nr:hypothetical protein [Candidatus Poribacteria bacterium]